MDTLLEKMRDSAVVFSQNAIDIIKKYVVNYNAKIYVFVKFLI